MTTAIIRFKENDQVELSSDRLVVGGHTGIRHTNKIIKLSDYVSFIYSGIYIDGRKQNIDWKTPFDVQDFIQAHDPDMSIVVFMGTPEGMYQIFFVTATYLETVTHDFAIGSGGESANALLRYSKEIPTKDIYATVASLDVFTSSKFDSILLP